jgi:hypothetical protein
MTNATGFDTNAYLAIAGRGNRSLDELQLPWSFDYYGSIS